MKRRKLLAISGSVMFGGCSGSDSPVRLGGVRLDNYNDIPVTVEIRVENSDDLVYDDTVSVDSDSHPVSTHIIDCTWDTESRNDYSIGAKLPDQNEWNEIILDAEHGSCQFVLIHLENEFIDFDSRDCDEYSETPCELIDS